MESKKLMKVGSIVVVVLMIVGWLVSSYNSMVSNQEEVTTAWSNVEAAYQRRADMMPQLAKIVKSYAKHECETFEQVTKARNAATQIHLDAADLTPEKLKAFEQAQNQVTQALSRLIAVSERYPDLKASENNFVISLVLAIVFFFVFLYFPEIFEHFAAVFKRRKLRFVALFRARDNVVPLYPRTVSGRIADNVVHGINIFSVVIERHTLYRVLRFV